MIKNSKEELLTNNKKFKGHGENGRQKPEDVNIYIYM